MRRLFIRARPWPIRFCRLLGNHPRPHEPQFMSMNLISLSLYSNSAPCPQSAQSCSPTGGARQRACRRGSRRSRRPAAHARARRRQRLPPPCSQSTRCAGYPQTTRYRRTRARGRRRGDQSPAAATRPTRPSPPRRRAPARRSILRRRPPRRLGLSTTVQWGKSRCASSPRR